MAALMAAMARNNNNENNNNNAIYKADANNNKDNTIEVDNKENNWGEDDNGGYCATITDQRICHPAPPLILDNAGATTVVIFVNNTGVPLSKPPMAAIVHISAGQQEEALADKH